MTRFTDEQVMAFADGECTDALGNELREALSADPELNARLAVFEDSRRVLRQAFEAKRAEAVPDQLMSAFGRAARTAPRGVALGARRRSYGMAVAASILFAVALSIGYLAGGRPGATLLPDSQLLTAALERTPGGVLFVQEQGVMRRELVPIRTLRMQAGVWCREFRFAEVVERVVNKAQGLACRGPHGGWSMRALWSPSALRNVAGSADGSYRPAAGPDAFADLGPVETINSVREAELIANGWR